MPGIIGIDDFVREVREDFNSPTTSNFVSRIPQCKETVCKLEETLASDKEGIVKLKNAVKDLYKTGNNFSSSETEISKVLNRLGDNAIMRDEEPQIDDEIGAAFQQFAVVTKELANLMGNLMKNLDSVIMFPVDRLLKTELRGSKGDMKRPFERSYKDYQDKFSEIERQKKKTAREAGLHRAEIIPGEIADEMDKERRYLQLTTAEYLIRFNDIKTKKGVNLIQQMIEYYKAQCKYFKDGLETLEQFGGNIEVLSHKLNKIQQSHDEDKRALVDVRNSLKNSPGFCKVNGSNTLGQIYTLHQAKGDASHGSQKSGYLSKRSEGRLRNVWQRRKCEIREGFLDIYHADESKAPTEVNLLTCQMKSAVVEDKACFDVVSYNRTYHFQADDEVDKERWMSVLLNAKEGAMTQAFNGNDGQDSTAGNKGFAELQRTLVNYLRNLPGNDKCCDCGSNNDATWLSTNYGIIVCIECSGIHREMGVHISKIQSLTLDNIGTSQLLIARAMTNDNFNKIMEVNCQTKPHPSSTMDERKAFIKAKYEEKRFVQPLCNSPQDVLSELEQAIYSHNLFDLLQAASEAANFGVDITDPLPTSEIAETSLHASISHENGHSLHLVDFLVQNSSCLDKQTREGNTPLHYCVIQNQCESLRLLLRSGANPNVENKNGKTPVDIAKERGHHLCEEMLIHALQRKKTMFENVHIDWHLAHLDDGSTDFSDDETLDAIDPSMTISSSSGKLNGSQQLSPNYSNNSSNSETKRPLSVFTPNKLFPPEWSKISDPKSQSPTSGKFGSISNMPPPPPPSGKKPSLFSSSNLKSHMGGSLKKGSKQSLSLPSHNNATLASAYATLPSSHHLRSPNNFGKQQQAGTNNNSHKRSPSSDSGHGTMHTNNNNNNQLIIGSSRSETPGSYKGPKVHHTVYLHVGTQSTANSDSSPPTKGFSEESSPENRITPPSGTGSAGSITRSLRNGQSTESLDSLSDGSNGIHNHHHRPHHIHQTRRNPIPPPRKRNEFSHLRRCRALYDCEADNDDELTFEEGDTILVLNEETEDENWMEGILENDPSKRGLFPVSFVHMIQEI